jgi:hypothetical protein
MTLLDYYGNPTRVADVLQWISIQQNEIGGSSSLDGARGVSMAQEFCRPNGCGA